MWGWYCLMRLKKLQIQGFKSFLDRTSIDFSEGITAVVGPNGCGKSNVVDAIRWAMGEQRARQLRGKSMEDVIFNGTQQFQPQGMAEVSLLFDNTQGMAPVEYSGFSEIQISRRLFRTGESEYSINRTPCRLKDITELFLGTGLGKQAYSIVEQGQIDKIISAKPEDRRVLIEEAAGVTKYRSRKQEAERKIESTRQNLLRIQDIVGEIKRQMNSLNRQAKKAERFKKYRDEVKQIDLELNVRRILTLYKEHDQLAGTLEIARKQEEQVRVGLESGEAEIESERTALLEAERELNRSQERMHELKNGIQSSENQQTLGQREIENKAQQVKRFEQEMEERRQNLGRQESELTHLAEDLAGLSVAREAAQKDTTEVKQKIESLARRQAEHTSELNEQRTKKGKLTGEVNRLEHDLTYNLERKKDMSERLERCQAEVKDLAPEMEGTQQLSMKFNENLYELRKIFSNLNERLETSSDELIELRQSVAREQARVEEIDDTYRNTRSRLQSLLEMQANFEGYERGVKSIMERKAEANGGSGIRGLIAEVIETEPRYELAVEAVLGERLQTVVVESSQAGLDAIEYLRLGERGRGCFVPAAAEHHAGTVIPEQLSAIGAKPLADVVQAPEAYSTVVQALLGETILVPSIEKATQVCNGNGIQHTMVTPEGVVIDPRGVMSGGSKDSFGLLEKRREIRELKARVEQLAQKLEVARKKLTSFKQDLVRKEQDHETLRNRRHQQELAIVNQEKDLKQSTDKFNQFKSRAEALTREQAELEKKIQTAAQTIGHAETELAAKRKQIQETSQQLSKLQNILDEVAPSLKAQNDKSTELRVRLAALDEKRQSAEAQIQRLNKMQQDQVRSIEHREHEREAARLEITRLKNQATEQQAALEKMIGDQAKFEAGLKEQREAYQARAQALRDKESGLSDLRKQIEDLKNQSRDLELRLDKLRIQAEHVAEAVQEKYFTDLERVVPEHQEKVSADDYPAEENKKHIEELRHKLDRMGDVNLTAIEEFKELEERHGFLTMQEGDLIEALDSLENTITKINSTYRREFKRTFVKVNKKFEQVCPKLFRGGKASMVLTDESDLLETGVDIVVQPPGKKLQAISLLSGGEKSLAAVALIVSLFLTRPSPFCLLDEVDAALDDMNVDRFNDIVKEMAQDSQFILITHNKRTMALAHNLYGVTMESKGVSNVVSVKLN